MSAIAGVNSSGFSSSSFSPSSFSTAGIPAAALPAAAPPDLSKGKKAAREFEAQLIGTVLESLEKTFATLPGQDGVAGEDNYNYLGTQALASGLAAGGGFGIAAVISKYLEARR